MTDFECTDDMDVPKRECEALVDLYGSTNGDGWLNNSGWLQSTTVADWYGVTVESRITRLDLSSNQLNGTIPSTLGDIKFGIFAANH